MIIKHSRTCAPKEKGFSLVEVAIAMSIVTFMVLPLVTLAVYAKDAIRDSTAESRAAAIARRVFTGLSLSSDSSQILIESPTDNREISFDFQTVDIADFISGKNDFYLLIDEQGKVIEHPGPEAYQQGYLGANNASLGGSFARIRILERRGSVLKQTTVLGGFDLYLVEVTVDYPAVVPKAARRSHTFSSYLGFSNHAKSLGTESKNQ